MKLNLNDDIMYRLRLDKAMQGIRATIDKGEFFKMAVSDKYPFIYTIGLYKLYKHPEILIFSPPPFEQILSIIQTVAENVENGFEYKDGEKYDGIISKFPLLFKTIERRYYSSYFGTAIRFYEGKSFPALHCLFPDAVGLFPSDVGCEKEPKEIQTLRITNK